MACGMMKQLKKLVTSKRKREKNLNKDCQSLNEESVLRRQIKEMLLELEKEEKDKLKLKEEHETKIILFQEDKRFFREEINSLRNELSEKQKKIECLKENQLFSKEGIKTKDEDNLVNQSTCIEETGMSDNLRIQIKMKQDELETLKAALGRAKRDEVAIEAVEKEYENLQEQLQGKIEFEKDMFKELLRLQNLMLENNMKKRK